MTHRGLDRREALQRLGGAMMLPFVPLLDVHRGPAAPPKRLVFFFSGNGTIHESWVPRMDGGELVLSPILSPLEKLKSKLLVVDGLRHAVVQEKSNRTGHAAGMNTVLTGRTTKIPDPRDPLRSLGTGESLDQYLAGKISSETKVRSIECGVQVALYLPGGRPRSPTAARSSPSSPRAAPPGSSIGSSAASPAPSLADGAAAAERLLDRQRVLSAVSMNLEALKQKLPRDDRVKMEARIIGAVVKNALERGPTTGVGAGAAANAGAGTPTWGRPSTPRPATARHPAIGRLQMDLPGDSGLACFRPPTRVGTIEFDPCAGAPTQIPASSRTEFATDPALGPTDMAKGFHALAHREADPAVRAKLVKIHTWYAGELGYLLGRLASIPEAGGSMLDSTVVVWINELGTGGDHGHDRTPWVIAGNAGGFFKTGQLVSFPGEPHNRLLLTLCHAMGVATDVFGDPDYCKAGSAHGASPRDARAPAGALVARGGMDALTSSRRHDALVDRGACESTRRTR